MNKEMSPIRWMGLIVILVGFAITVSLFLRFGILGLFAGMIIFLILIIVYYLWVRMVRAKTTYEVLKQYAIRKKGPNTGGED